MLKIEDKIDVVCVSLLGSDGCHSCTAAAGVTSDIVCP